MDWSSPGSPGHRIILARISEWVTIFSSRGLPNTGIKPVSPVSPVFLALQVDFLSLSHWGNPIKQDSQHSLHQDRQKYCLVYTYPKLLKECPLLLRRNAIKGFIQNLCHQFSPLMKRSVLFFNNMISQLCLLCLK